MFTRKKAERIGEEVLRELSPMIKKGVIAGSLRRGEKKVEDIDLVVVPRKEWETDRKLLFEKREGVEVNIFIAPAEEFVSTLFHATGPRGHNIGIAQKAKKLGLKWRGMHGLAKDDKPIPVSSERDIYRRLKTPYKAPEDRGQ